MSFVIKLHVFSGRPDPIWILSENDAQTLRAQLSNVGEIEPPSSGTLGYRGFSILDSDPTSENDGFLFRNSHSNAQTGAFLAGVPEIEMFLLSTAREAISPNVAEHVQTSIARGVIEAPSEFRALSCPTNHGTDAPAYDPGFWNNNDFRRLNNNCYNYANDNATNTFAQPGRGTGQQYTRFACSDVQPASERDGLLPTQNFQTPTAGWYTALVVWPSEDYHWYRQDTSGCWTHKPGRQFVKDFDDSGQPITDPATADRGPYVDFCSYYVTNRGVIIA